MFEIVVFSLLNGAIYGMLLFMLASGLTVIMSMMGVLNFAHASFYMLGAYFAFVISRYTNFWVALVFAPILVGFLGALVERYMLTQVHKHGHLPELLLTFGLAFVIEKAVQMIWGLLPVRYRVPESLDFALFTLFGAEYPAYRMFMLAVSACIFLTLYLVLTRTRVGLIVQASLTHPDMVGALGHNVARVFTLVFAGGTALAGLAGVIGGNYLVTEPGMAISLGSIVFVVVVFGGLGSLPGAFIAAMLIAMIQTFSVALNYSLTDLVTAVGLSLPPDSFFATALSIELARLGPVLPYLMLVLILIFRPKGLMGTRES